MLVIIDRYCIKCLNPSKGAGIDHSLGTFLKDNGDVLARPTFQL